MTQFGVHAGGKHGGFACAGGDACASKDEAWHLGSGQLNLLHRVCHLAH